MVDTERKWGAGGREPPRRMEDTSPGPSGSPKNEPIGPTKGSRPQGSRADAVAAVAGGGAHRSSWSQFLRMELCSSKISPLRKGYEQARGQQGRGVDPKRTVEEACFEAARVAGNHPHVPEPGEPGRLYGIDPADIPALLQKEVERLNAELRDQRIALSPGTSAVGKAPIRVDTPILIHTVASHPILCTDDGQGAPSLDDPIYRDMARTWAADWRAWKLADASKRGLRVLSMIVHLDERHLHIHCFEVAGNPRLDARQGHPGWRAKLAVKRLPGETTAATECRANAAYRSALRAWQDEHHAEVGAKHGLSRLGPCRARVSRGQAIAARILSEGVVRVQKAAIVAERQHGARLEQQRREAEEVAAELRQIRRQAGKGRTEIANMRRKYADLRAKAEAEALRGEDARSERERVEKAVGETRALLVSVGTDLADAELARDAARADLAEERRALRRRRRRGRLLKEVMGRAVGRLGELRRQRQALVDEVSALRAVREELCGAHEKLEDTKRATSALEEKAHELKEQIAQSVKKRDQQIADEDLLLERLGSIANVCRGAEAKARASEAELARVERELKERTAAAAAAEAQRKRAVDEEETVRARRDALALEVEAAAKSLDQTRRARATLNELMESDRVARSSAREELAQDQAECARRVAELDGRLAAVDAIVKGHLFLGKKGKGGRRLLYEGPADLPARVAPAEAWVAANLEGFYLGVLDARLAPDAITLAVRGWARGWFDGVAAKPRKDGRPCLLIAHEAPSDCAALVEPVLETVALVLRALPDRAEIDRVGCELESWLPTARAQRLRQGLAPFQSPGWRRGAER